MTQCSSVIPKPERITSVSPPCQQEPSRGHSLVLRGQLYDNTHQPPRPSLPSIRYTSQSFLEPRTDFIKFVPVTDPLCTPCNQQQLLTSMCWIFPINILDFDHGQKTPKSWILTCNIENLGRYGAIQQMLGVFQKQRTKEYLKAAQVWWRVGTD